MAAPTKAEPATYTRPIPPNDVRAADDGDVVGDEPPLLDDDEPPAGEVAVAVVNDEVVVPFAQTAVGVTFVERVRSAHWAGDKDVR